MSYCIIKTTTSNEAEAELIAKHLVENKLTACCSVIPKIKSIYIWKGSLSSDSEALIIMKTRLELYSQIEKEIKKLHKYENPEIICIPIIKGSEEYLSWIDEQTAK